MPQHRTPAAQQFADLGIDPSEWTDTMRLAVKQKWSGLPVDEKVGDLRARLTTVALPDLPSIDDLKAELNLDDAAALAEQKRLKRNASVNAWRARNQIQAALDAREIKFAHLRAKRGTSAKAKAGSETGDRAKVSA